MSELDAAGGLSAASAAGPRRLADKLSVIKAGTIGRDALTYDAFYDCVMTGTRTTALRPTSIRALTERARSVE